MIHSGRVKDPVLPNMHCALQTSAAIFLMLKNPVGLVRFHWPRESLKVALIIYQATLA